MRTKQFIFNVTYENCKGLIPYWDKVFKIGKSDCDEGKKNENASSESRITEMKAEGGWIIPAEIYQLYLIIFNGKGQEMKNVNENWVFGLVSNSISTLMVYLQSKESL